MPVTKKKTVSKSKKKASPAKPKPKPKPMAALSGLHSGDTAPAFRLLSDTGNPVALKDFAGQRVVLYFYPKDSTPGCTQEACDFRDSFRRVQAQGAIVLGVSKDSVASHQRFKAKYGFPFPLLSDETGKVLEAYQVWAEKSLYGRKFMGIVRTTYLIDVDAKGKGIIRKAYPKVKVAGHVDEVLADLGKV
jgi:peroxiredoxin Q/BCP